MTDLQAALATHDKELLARYTGAGNETYEDFLRLLPGARQTAPELDCVQPRPHCATAAVGVVRRPPPDRGGERWEQEDEGGQGAGSHVRTDADVFLEVQADAGRPLPGAGGSAFAEEEELEELDMEGLANVVHGGRMNAPASPGRLAVDNFLPDSAEEEDEDEDGGGGGGYMPSMMGGQKRRGAGGSGAEGDSGGYVPSMVRPQAVAASDGQGITRGMLGWEGLEAGSEPEPDDSDGGDGGDGGDDEDLMALVASMAEGKQLRAARHGGGDGGGGNGAAAGVGASASLGGGGGADAEMQGWEADSLPGGCSAQQTSPERRSAGELQRGVRMAAEAVDDGESADVDPEASEVEVEVEVAAAAAARRAALHLLDGGGGDAPGAAEENPEQPPQQPPPPPQEAEAEAELEAAAWEDPVEAFELDEQFDYDGVTLTPKVNVEQMRREWLAARQGEAAAAASKRGNGATGNA
eukprot:COSAG01_NODE_1125_length_11596_cov_8.205532_5_plen_467_part_00